MSEPDEISCPECGAAFEAGAFGGLCPRCMLSDIIVDQEAVADGALPDLAGTQIDGYQLVEKIGEGGMGSVWRARQSAPVERDVALKLIKAGMESQSLVARFEAERQALADLDHPGIAKIFDAGATETGRPYYVMELVDGLPITGYCERWQLLTRDRLALLLKVCDAVGHAHSKGITHRDLKPSNLLVADHIEGKLKVIDFGVAKSDEPVAPDLTQATRAGQLVGTPSYMSPEQAGGEATVDGRSDVYSLGAVLYELLCAEPPFDEEVLREAGLLEMTRVIREEIPPKPSSRTVELTAGPLDWIALKALSKRPADRYASPGDLADDIGRFLKGERTSASAPLPGAALVRWLRRHRAAALAVLFAIPLALSIYALSRPSAEPVDPTAVHAADMVTSKADSGPGSLRAMIAAAAPRSTLRFAPELSGATIVLAGGPLLIDKTLVIDAHDLDRRVTVDGGGKSRLFEVSGKSTVAELKGFVLTGGDAGDGDGGAILVASRLNLKGCHLHHNRARSGGAVAAVEAGNIDVRTSLFTDNIASVYGGAVWNGGRANNRFLGCAFARNQAQQGGALYGGSLSLWSCTIADNACVPRPGDDSPTLGGGVKIEGGTLGLRYCTVTRNRAAEGGGVHAHSPRELIFFFTNSIIAGNQASGGGGKDDFYSNHFYDERGNLTNFAEPLLAPFGDYGGPVPTCPPLPGSPAIDRGVVLGVEDEKGNFSVQLPTDFALPPPIDGDGDGVAVFDSGAVEFDPAGEPR